MLFITKFITAVNTLLNQANVGVTIDRLPGEETTFPFCTISQTENTIINFKGEGTPPSQKTMPISFFLVDQSRDFSVLEKIADKFINAIANKESELNALIEGNKVLDCQIVGITENYKEDQKDILIQIQLNFNILFE